MTRYIFKRLFLLVIALFVIVTIAFFLMQLIPGYPKAVETQISMAKPEQIPGIIARYNLDETNPFVEYGNYISGLFHGDLGIYYETPSRSIWSVFMGPMKFTMMVTIPAFIMGTLLGISFGFISGYKRGKLPDIAVNIFAVFFVSIPSFILAIALVFFGKATGLPIEFAGENVSFWKQMESLILPILIMTLTSFATLTYYVRNEVVEVLSSDYITIARSKGVSEKRLLFKHVMRNVSIPMITIILPSFVFMISGSMIIETFFSVPGSSTIFVKAVPNREIYVVMFSVLFFSALSMLTSLITDILYVTLDPRIRLAEKNKKSWITSVKNELKRKNNFRNEVQNAK